MENRTDTLFCNYLEISWRLKAGDIHLVSYFTSQLLHVRIDPDQCHVVPDPFVGQHDPSEPILNHFQGQRLTQKWVSLPKLGIRVKFDPGVFRVCVSQWYHFTPAVGLLLYWVNLNFKFLPHSILQKLVLNWHQGVVT